MKAVMLIKWLYLNNYSRISFHYLLLWDQWKVLKH